MNKFSNQFFDIGCLDVDYLEKISQEFFKSLGTQRLLGEPFFTQIDAGPGRNLFENLINTCGFKKNIKGFFELLFSRINSRDKEKMVINGVKIPRFYLYRLLEAVIPGNKLHSIKTVEQLEKRAFVRTDDTQKTQEVLDQFPVRLSDHVIRQSLVSDGVAKQYLPFVEELDSTGHTITFDGHFKKGVLEQMYKNRVIFLLDMQCPVYCRFCFRKHKSTRKEKRSTPEDVTAATDHVKNHSSIKEILITGGEPLLNRPSLETALNALITIDHVQTIRIATRSIAYYPDLFLKNNRGYIQYLLEKNTRALNHGKRIEIGLHFVHPDEVSIQSLDIISQLVKNGIQVYVQTPFLNGLNTQGVTLGRLFTLLRQAGAKIYYIFTPCSPIHGTKEYWTSISQAKAAAKLLRENFSDRCIPKLCTATPLGKIEWQTSGWAVETDKTDENYTWIRTPYTLAYFKKFIHDVKQMPDLRVNNEGTLDARFRVSMGENVRLTGERCSKKSPSVPSEPGIDKKEIDAIRSFLLAGTGLGPSIRPTLSKQISRVHKTRLEMDFTAGQDAIVYIKGNPNITDVVIHWGDMNDASREKVSHLVAQLKMVSHIVCIRLCCKQLHNRPQLFTKAFIEAISQWCDFSIGTPVKVEIETWFLLPKDITAAHGKMAGNLIGKGINVYANVPLIHRVNDQPEIIERLAHKLRQAAIEFHHFYVSGLDIQTKFNTQACVDPQRVIDIASRVRKNCSGREIPLYIVQTSLGEEEFSFKPFIEC